MVSETRYCDYGIVAPVCRLGLSPTVYYYDRTGYLGGLLAVKGCAKVFVKHSDGSRDQLNAGYIESGNHTGQGYALKTANWDCPELEAPDIVPSDEIEVEFYVKISVIYYFALAWQTVGLNASKLNAATWTFNFWLDRIYPYLVDFTYGAILMYPANDTYIDNITYEVGLTQISVAGSTLGSGSLLRNKALTVSGSSIGAGVLLRGKAFTLAGSTITLGSVTRGKKLSVSGATVATGILWTSKTLIVQGLVNGYGDVSISVFPKIEVLGAVFAQGLITIVKTIVPVGPPTFPAGGVPSRQPAKNMLVTVDGQIFLDFQYFLLSLDGQVFLNLNGVYASLDRQVLVNLNMKKPVYMIIN